MSLGARASKGGAKTGKEKTQEKGKPDKPQPKEKVKPQATTEQLRMAHMIDRKSDDASDVRRMVLELMEMTRRTEEEVCSALHDSDNDMVAACNLLLEDTHRIQGEWQTSEKKKKKPASAGGNGEAEPPRDETRSRSGPRPRRGEGEGGRGRTSGRGRGGARGRGGRRGTGPRPRPHRDERAHTWGHGNEGGQDNTGGGGADTFPTTEDWDNEEWSGSLSDTKVFTPSTAQPEPEPVATEEDWDGPAATNAAGVGGASETHIPTYTVHSAIHNTPLIEQMSTANNHANAYSEPAPIDSYRSTPHHQKMTTANSHASAYSEPAPIDSYRATQHHQPMGMSGSLSAAQSQYLSALTAAAAARAQPHSAHAHVASHAPPHQAHAAPAPSVAPAQHQDTQQRKPRAKVPPPSKIPSMAVEMPGGEASSMFLDVQFGALEPDTLADACAAPPAAHQPAHAQAHQPTHAPAHAPTHAPTHAPSPQPAPTQTQQPAANKQPPMPEPPVVSSAHEPAPEPVSSYPNSNSMLSESLSVVDTTPSSQPQVTTESIVTNASTLEKQLTAGMKQLSVSNEQPTQQYTAPAMHPHHRPKTVGQQQNVYAHHAVSHHPPVYGANVYAPQVNSTNASLTGASGMTYPSSVTLTQYQPMMNSYQQTSSSATVYGGNALYTAAAAPYTAYQPQQPKLQPKDTPQYDNSVASNSNSLTSTSTTQASSTAKVATTTVSAAGNSAVAGSGVSGSAANTYAAGALYGATTNATYAAYDEQMMRSTLPHHMGGYYEVGYGVGTRGTEGTFGLGAGERFGRADAASPQQVPAAALPPGYAYFYQPPPTTYQYGVYPTYGGGSNVGGVGGVSGGGVGGVSGKLSTYAPQQPPYDAQDSYKPAGPYTGNSKASAGGAAADLTNAAMYAKTHVALSKVNSYEKAAFHSGTPPPFGATSHLYIPAPPHHHPHHHAPQHQMDARVSSSHNRRESGGGAGGAGGARASANKPPASKPTYSQSYWAPN